MKLIRLVDSVKTKIGRIVKAIPAELRRQWNLCIVYASLLPLADLISAYWMYLIVMAMQNRGISLAGYVIHSPAQNNFAILIVGFILLSIIRQVISFASVSTSRKFTQNIYKNYSVRLITSYLSMPWLNFTGDTRSSKIKHCTQTTLNAAFSFQVVLNFISSFLTLSLLGTATFVRVPILAISALTSLLIVSTIIKRRIAVKMRAAVLSHENNQKDYFQKLNEAFNLPREMNLFGVKNYFLNNLESLLKKLSKANTDLSIYPQIPKIAIELVLTISLTIGIVITLLSGTYSSAELIANTATVALLARRIIPSMSDFLSAYTELYGSMMNIEIIQREFEEEYPVSEIKTNDNLPSGTLLKLENIAFAYPGKERILHNASLEVNENDRIMLHGKTGKGKSTLLMIAAGIISPSDGTASISKKIGTGFPLAYVAQETVLMRGTVLDNIVFGSSLIDRSLANEVLTLVNLDAHIHSLSNSLDAEIGDNGVSFSGGQRQRLGIARALYNKPALLFLDEATSALDEETEAIVMRNIDRYMADGAVLFITHRTSIGEKFANKTCFL